MKPGVTKSVIADVDTPTSQCQHCAIGFTRDPSATTQGVQRMSENATEFLLGRSKIFLDILE